MIVSHWKLDKKRDQGVGGMMPGSIKDPVTLRRMSLRRNQPYRAGFTQVCGLLKQVREGGKGVDVTRRGVVITMGHEI